MSTSPHATYLTIPDVFSSFLAQSPGLNVHYENVSLESIAWMSKICNLSEKEQTRLHQADFGYFAAVAYPDCTSERLRTITDWFNWVFAFDDVLDDGLLGDDREASIAYVRRALNVLDMSSGTQISAAHQPAHYVLKSICDRLKQDVDWPEDAKCRWIAGMKDYMQGLITAVDFQPGTSLEDTIRLYMAHRAKSISILPLFAFVEYASSLQIPRFMFDHIAMQRLEVIGIKVQMLVNDCVSYHREHDLNCPHNIIHWLRYHGHSEQEAYDEVQALLYQSYNEWYLALSEVPVRGEAIDRPVQRYIKGLQDIALANSHWSFRTSRYFGKDRHNIRITRQLPKRIDWQESVVVKTEMELQEAREEALRPESDQSIR